MIYGRAVSVTKRMITTLYLRGWDALNSYRVCVVYARNWETSGHGGSMIILCVVEFVNEREFCNVHITSRPPESSHNRGTHIELNSMTRHKPKAIQFHQIPSQVNLAI